MGRSKTFTSTMWVFNTKRGKNNKICSYHVRSVEDLKNINYRSSNLDAIQPNSRPAVFTDKNQIKTKAPMVVFGTKCNKAHLRSYCRVKVISTTNGCKALRIQRPHVERTNRLWIFMITKYYVFCENRSFVGSRPK